MGANEKVAGRALTPAAAQKRIAATPAPAIVGAVGAGMRRGSITLGDLAGKIAMLEVACSRCQRRGRLWVDRLIEQHGDAERPELRPPGRRLPEGRGHLDQRSVRHLLPAAQRVLTPAGRWFCNLAGLLTRQLNISCRR
jgi:hypothetical protein